MKIIGFLGGQYGDAIITLGAQSVVRKLYPDCEFTFAISQKYAGILPLFENQPNIQRMHTWEGYDHEWPTRADREFLEKEKFDIVFSPMQAHREPDWFLRRHQVSECCHMYGLPEPETNRVVLNPVEDINADYKGCVTLSLLPNNGKGIKVLNPNTSNQICDFIKQKKYKTVQLAGPQDFKLLGANETHYGSFMSATSILRASKLLITGDTSMCWLAAAYNIPVVGLFAHGYYPQAKTSKNWQPINENAIYLEAFSVNDIPLRSIFEAIESKL